MRGFRWRWIGALATGWLALTVAHAILPAQARAGCTHGWVTSKSASLSLLDPSFFASGTGAHKANGKSHESPDRRDPCARGECSRPSGLPVAPSIDFSLELDHWIALRPGWASLSIRSRILVPADERQHSSSNPFPIERPPRFGCDR